MNADAADSGGSELPGRDGIVSLDTVVDTTLGGELLERPGNAPEGPKGRPTAGRGLGWGCWRDL